MGLYDRDYSREPTEYRFGGAGSAQSVTIVLIAINVGVYVLDRLMSSNDPSGQVVNSFMSSLASGPDTLTKPWLWWKFVTAGFAHDPVGIGHIFSNMFVLWMFGKNVEQVLGRGEFLRFYMLSLVLGNVFTAVRQYLLVSPAQWSDGYGASGAVTAVFVLFICYFPTSTLLFMFVIPMRAWVLGVILIGWEMLGALTPPPPGEPMIAHDVHLAGAAFALAYWRFKWNIGRFAPLSALSAIPSWFTRPRLKVHRPSRDARQLDAEADRVLQKLHEQGEASLTAQERRTLEEYSRRLRQRNS